MNMYCEAIFHLIITGEVKLHCEFHLFPKAALTAFPAADVMSVGSWKHKTVHFFSNFLKAHFFFFPSAVRYCQ